MKNLILNLMFKYKWHTTIFFIVVYIILIVFYLNPITFDNVFGSFIFLLLLISSLWNVSFLLLNSIDENSTFNEIIGRGILIFVYFIGLILVVIT
jgi:hypothetical protein